MATATSHHSHVHGLGRHEGVLFLSAGEAILKGALESEVPVSLICGPRREPFVGLFRLRGVEPVSSMLRRHGTRLQAVPDSRRAVTLAWQAALRGRSAMAAIPADQLEHALEQIRRTDMRPLAGGAMTIILEDRPSERASLSPREIATRLNWPVIEPSDIADLRDAIETAMRLSRASNRPAAIIAHTCLLHMAETLPAHPNRVPTAGEPVTVSRRRRRQRVSDAGDLLRVARRLEVNRVRNMPSPGERLPVGFVVIGVAAATLRHLVDVLGLIGRVPALEMRLIHPLDEVPVGRLLTRCEHVVVLEPRPGELEGAVLAVAEQLRRGGNRPATVWGRTIPPDPSGVEYHLGQDDAIHPSVLVRRIVHLLHSIRPTLQVASRLIPEMHRPDIEFEPRRALIGASGATIALRALVEEANRRLEEAAAADDEASPRRLVLEPATVDAGDDFVVLTEIWEHRPFIEEGVLAVVQAAREDRPRMLLVCEQASEEVSDLERLARAVVPADRAANVKVDAVNLADRPTVIEELVRVASNDGLTVLVVRDGPPARFDVATLERSLSEIDQLGFQPRQTITCSADLACAIRPTADPILRKSRFGRDADPLSTEVSIGRRARGRSSRLRISVRPLLDQIDVLRERPPTWRVRSGADEGLSMPKPFHGRHPQWRAHLAGFRGDPPGPAARVLCVAGGLMGYAVKSVYDSDPVAPGRRAWAQVLFTRPRKGEHLSPLSAITPFGEADLIVGMDAGESLRAIGSDPSLRVAIADHSYAVINTGRFDEDQEPDSEQPEIDEATFARLGLLRSQPLLIDDLAAACRSWFHTDRVTDMALLGAAFQLGLIPVTLDAIEAAIEQVEVDGFGRSLDAFRFGRRFAVDPRPAARPRLDGSEPLERLGRRIVLSLRSGRRRERAAAQPFDGLIRRSLSAMPGLTETDRGRQARWDFIHALHRCFVWGGVEYAQRYAELVTMLYRVDRGDTGRAITRNIILPLAEAMLIRDSIYIAAMATSAEQRRRTHLRLNVKHARGDRIVRRFLTRIELVGFGRHLRLDLRTGDWAARRLAAIGRVLPTAWRGGRVRRGVRAYIIDFVIRASDQAGQDYERWNAAARLLQSLAEEGRLSDLSAEDLREMTEPEPIETVDEPVTDPAVL